MQYHVVTLSKLYLCLQYLSTFGILNLILLMILPVFQRIASKSVCVTKQRGGKQFSGITGCFVNEATDSQKNDNIILPVLFVSAPRPARICCLV